MKNSRLISFGLLVFGLFIYLPQGFSEQSKGEETAKPSMMTGKIMGKTRQNISVEYENKGDQTFEALIPIDSKTKLAGYKKFQDIQEGDVVRVEMLKTFVTDDDGNEIKTGTLATSITLIRSNTAGKLVSRER